MSILKGNIAALLTPYKEDKSVCYETLRHYIGFLLDKGCDGLLCNSSVGDAQALPLKDQLEIIKLAKEVSKNEAPMIAGVGSPCYENTKLLIQMAREQKADALLLMLPYYYNFSDDSMYEYIKEVTSLAKMPIYLHNAPVYGCAMSVSLCTRLAALPGVVGIKDSSANILELQVILSKVDENFELLIGREECCALGQIAGAKGYITAFGAIFPELMSALFKAIAQNEIEKGMYLQNLLLKPLGFILSFPFPMGYSLLLQARGIDFKNTSIHTLGSDVTSKLEAAKDKADEMVRYILSSLHEAQLCSIA